LGLADFNSFFLAISQIKNKAILERRLPDALKLSIAHKIENNLFSKVLESGFLAYDFINHSKILDCADSISLHA
jgi:hypothetical protein